MRGWRNWQTRHLEVVVPARAWRFESSLAHRVPRERAMPHSENHGRLAQLVERYIDVVDVIGSSPIPPTSVVGYENRESP